MMAIKRTESWWPSLLEDDVRPHYYPPHLLLRQLCLPLWSYSVTNYLGIHVCSLWMSTSPSTSTWAHLKRKAIQLIRNILKNKGCCFFFSEQCSSVLSVSLRQCGSLSMHTWQFNHLHGLHRQLLFCSVFPKVLLSRNLKFEVSNQREFTRWLANVLADCCHQLSCASQ